MQIFSTLLVLGQLTRSPYIYGTKCGVQDSAAELRNEPLAHLATGRAQVVPIYSPGMRNTPLSENRTWLLRVHGYYILSPIIVLPRKGIISPKCIIST